MSENSAATAGRPASFGGSRASRATTEATPAMSLRWRPSANGNGPQLAVTHGDLTTCAADAIVNPANSSLFHGGGVAGAIASKGGRVIDDESKAWIETNKRLPVGHAMSTRSGELPCRFVIHTVGPMVGGGGYSFPSDEQAQQLRDAVWSALQEADNLQLASIAMPGISTGYFGYPHELAAVEIVGECVRYACEKADSTTLTTIVLMNIDIPTCRSFAQALQQTAVLCGQGGIPKPVRGDPMSQRHKREDDDDDDNYHVKDEDNEQLKPAPKRAPGWSSLLWRKTPITIVPVRVGATDFELLLGVETSSFGFSIASHRCVNVLSGDGGKLWENGVEAKCRVLSKAIGGVVAIDTLRDSIKHSSCELRLESIHTTLTFVCLESDCAHSLPHKFEQWRQKSWLSTAANAHLVWVSWRDLKAIATTPAKPSFRYDEGKLRTPFGVFPLATTLSQAIKKHGAEVENQLQSLLLEETIAHEVDRVATLHATSDDELLARVLGRDWKLRLTSPQMPPATPLELLTPEDADYKAFASELPIHVASRIVSVRRVRASARRGEYKKVKQEITDPRVKEIQPLFHGTPERWRATAIALNGFDLAIKLHGRSQGHGVYTSTDVNMALGYAVDQGSVMRLRGLVASNCRANKGFNTIVHGCVYVFPNPKAVLPIAIADYAAEDERDQVEQKRQQAHAEYSSMQKRRRAVEMEMGAKEDEYKQRAQKRLRVALDVYSTSLAKVQAAMMAPAATSERSASRQFFQERRHFEQCLPMYEVKPALVQLLRTTPITIIVADTGSGKSTQLPQILLDDVVPTTETRRIAILEPRRINAISLSKRVSEERGSVPGQEVGYTIGRGDSNVSRGVTRLEYMTHGLFVQLARDPAYLVKHYCAVIVDEAHERSVDVDLSLALLQRVLKQQHQSGDSFRVIVTSATIEEEAQKIQSYLDPSLQHSAVFRVHGRTFPVYVEHRTDVQVDRTALGTANVGKVLTSAAIQSAVELLRTTEKGNILVFLPGEGSINEALAVARSEIAMSATVETVDTFSSGSSAFCFRMSTLSAGQLDDYDDDSSPGMRRNMVTTYVVGFHGKITRAERDRVLHPWDLHTRWVVFTTNIAETGVTLPNVRYVIDTGLERRVRWNATLDMNEMVTAPISKSSMAQRAGRAGRTASGICIRLYPDEAAGEFASPAVVPAVQNAMIYKAVLLMKELESRGEESLELLDPIEPKTWAQAQQRLVALGALDADDATLTQEGAALLRLGIDLRQGRFLIACARFGCLATGVKLVSLLIATDAPERLLPQRYNPTRAERMKPLIDPSGDHLTLLNVFEAYEKAHNEGCAMRWCQQMGFAYDVFMEAEIAREYLLKVLDGLHFPLTDDHKAMAKADGKRACIRRALCAAFYDQLARPRMASTAKNGFVRVLDKLTRRHIQRNAAMFASQTQANGDDDDSDNDTESGQAAVEATKEAAVKLGGGSTMWIKEIAATLASTDELVVFGSLILTDGAAQCDATVHLLTHVTPADVKAGASQWCRLVDFDALLQQSSRKSLVFDLPGGLARSFVMNGGAWLKNLQRTFGSSVVATVQDGDKLCVTCPRHRRARVEHYLRKRIPFVAPESVVIRLPDHVNMGHLLGKQGQQIESLRADIDQLLASQDCGAGHEHVRTRPLYVDTDKKTVTVTLQGASKPMMSVVVGHVQSKITQLLGADTLPLALDASGERGQQMQRCPRLAQLLNHIPPTAWDTRDDIMLQIAHALVWKCDASIHGGFVRDWVVRGDAANDIDVQLAPPHTTEASVEQALTAFLAQTPGAIAKALVVSNKWTKGVARTLTITGTGLAVPIDVDLVDRENLKSVVAPPGVDCDAGNLLLNRTESLRKKIRSAGESLSVALENVHEKRFDFYYPLGPGSPHQAMSVARLKKYLARGWTCVSRVPRAVQAQLSQNERALLAFVQAAEEEEEEAP